MLWLTWQMWILLMLAFAGGVIAGWSMRARSDELPEREDAKAVPEPVAPVKPAPALAPVLEPVEASEPDITAPAPAEPNEQTNGESEDVESAAAPAGSKSYALTDIKGLGPKAAEKLQAAGIERVDQIAAWGDAEIEKFDTLINGRGRIQRDDWVGQAKALANS